MAGPARAVEKLKPYTTGVMGRAVVDLSDQDPGKALLLKLIGNTFILNLVEAIAQGLTMAEKTGLGVDNLHKFIELMFPGPYTAYSNRMREGDYFKREEVSSLTL
jgi:3-hydroxyisobutyrate dehydrogenase-like beta-hydroxyacid dehydrogenase